MSEAGSRREDRAAGAFRAMAGRSPEGVWCSPARVNLVGEHTDYNGGLALPVAIDPSCVVAAGLRADGVVRCASLQVPGAVAVALDEVGRGHAAGWAGPVLGALWGMRTLGFETPGVDLVVDSHIPIGAGLASSAALGVATVLAAAGLTGARISTAEVARCCQAGETEVAGAPTGLMDQVAVLSGRAGHAVFLDCATLEHELVPFAPQSAGCALLVIDTAVRHDNSANAYRDRRDQCAAAASALGVPSLRDATLGAVSTMLDGTLRRRARHVLTENERVARVVDLLRDGRFADVGVVLNESHASLRDDYEVSSVELDCAVEAARRAGAWGARLTGAGFGGCAIALVPSAGVAAVTEAVRDEFGRRGHDAPHVFAAIGVDGARRCR